MKKTREGTVVGLGQGSVKVLLYRDAHLPSPYRKSETNGQQNSVARHQGQAGFKGGAGEDKHARGGKKKKKPRKMVV